jgi:hypothetical protein
MTAGRGIVRVSSPTNFLACERAMLKASIVFFPKGLG